MKTKIPLKLIEVEENNYHILASYSGSGTDAVYWVIDTGASKTVFDRNLVEKAGIEEKAVDFQTAGIGVSSFNVAMGGMKNLIMGGKNLGQFDVALIDLSHINELYKKNGNPQICGMIGSDVLLRFKALIDYKNKVLVLR